MPIPGIRFGTARQEGDDTFVTFFLVFLILALGIASWFVAPRNEDTLIGLAPRSAVLYAHATGEGVERLSALLPASLSGLKPRELSVFAVQSSDPKESGLNWGYLMSWGRENPEELSARHPILADLPRRQNDSVFVLTEGSANRAAELASIGGSMAEDEVVFRSLRHVSGFSKSQMYVRPEGMQALFGFGGMRPEVAQVVLWRQPNRLVFAPVGEIGPEIAALSFGHRNQEETFRGPEWSDMVVSGDVRESRNLLVEIILGSDWLDSDAVTVSSGKRLLGLFTNANYLAAGSLGEKRAKFMVHLQASDNFELEAALMDYFATKKPIMRNVSMPDGSNLQEMALDGKWLQFVVRGGDGYRVLTSSEDDVEVPSFTVLSDESGGFWLADSPERIQSRELVQVENGDRVLCLKNNGANSDSWFKTGWLKGNQLCVEEIVDKSVVIYSNIR